MCISVSLPPPPSPFARLFPILCRKPTKIGIRWTQAGEKVRVARKTETILPRPAERATERSYIRPAEAGPKDTPASAVSAVTFFPPAALLPYLAAAAESPSGSAAKNGGVGGSTIPSTSPRSIFVNRKGGASRMGILVFEWEGLDSFCLTAI